MNKVVLITGSSRGIGASSIKKFARNGYNVVINYYKNEEEGLKLKDYVEKEYKVKALIIKCDVSIEEEVKKMVEIIIENFGKIDVLVNNASISNDTLYEDKTVSSFKRILDVNLIGTFLVTKYVGEYMLRQGYGVITNVSSTNAIDTNYPMSIDYDASKAGVISLTHNQAIQYAPNIRVNAIAPGWTDTDMNKDMDLSYKEKEVNKIMLKRFAKPEEIANVIYFLATDDASYINNTVIKVDGGNINV
ncbi:MAG: SDR family oxidoreductase [Bacilli bacterium]|nr:SDR family oxidoreductase [Bacilli bacterium]MDD4733327.1 SDR family oxidoreductase [Bacilli bacterium]